MLFNFLDFDYKLNPTEGNKVDKAMVKEMLERNLWVEEENLLC